MVDTKKSQKFKTIVLAVLLTVCLIGAGAYGFFSNKGSDIGSPSSSSSNNSDYSAAQN